MKHDKKKKPIALIVAIVVILIVAGAAAFFLWPGDESKQGEEPAQPTNNQVADSDDAAEEVQQDVLIETPYADLYIPADKAESMRYELTEGENGCHVAFYGTAGDKDEEWLYTFWFGDANEGAFPVGEVAADSDKAVSVSLEISEFVPGDDWATEESDEFFAMQETMNYVLEKLSEEESFSEV